ncbi:SH3 domain-containing protein, partial [Ancylobacter sp. A5.8]|uniref:SH3 domain-containing protein n=1 Tax=Ancylobacter gelatini TaxID=2919920 RepID=UPI001F4D6848
TPGTAPTLGTNYRQPYGTTAQAAPAPGYDADAAAVLAGTPATSRGPGSFGTMKGARTTIGETNVRSGPGVEYSVIKTLPDFTKVEVQSCANTWCQTDEGYISLFHLSRGPVQQILSSAAQPLLPGSGSRDSAYYADNLAAQATMGYGAAGQGVAIGGVPTGVPGIAAPYAASNTNYRVPVAQRLAAQPVANLAPGYAPNAYGATPYGVAGGQATVRANVNVRSGPGTRFNVVGSLPAGAPVDIMSCTGSWCQTQYGYVSARLVSQGTLYAGAQPAAARAYGAPNYALASPGTNYRQPVAPQLIAQPAVQQRPFLPAQPGVTPGITPGTAPTLGTNYRQPYGTTAQAAPALPQASGYPAAGYQDPRRYGVAGVAAGQGYSAVTVAALNVRSGPGIGYDILGTLAAGSPVNVVSCAGSWCQTQYGYVSARHISTGSAGASYQAPAAQPATYARASYSAPATAPVYAQPTYSQPAYVQPAYAQSSYGNAYAPDPTFGGAYTGSRYIPGATYPTYTPSLGNLAADIAAPFEALATAATYSFGEGGWGGGWYNAPAEPLGNNWRVSRGPQFSYGTRDRGPGYWGPSLYGRNIPSNWGARPSYWGGRPTYWNAHPGYPVQAYRGDRRGNYYWSTRNAGLRPQPARWYTGGSSGLGPRWQGPYDAGPRYNGRPVVWRPRAGLF